MEGFYLDLNEIGKVEVLKRKIRYVEVGGKLLTVGQAYNNPGNIMGKWGTNPKSKDGYVIFPTPEAGWTALKRQISLNMSKRMTFQEFFAGQRNPDGSVKPGGYYGYAPAAHGNSPNIYAQFVANELNKKFGRGWDLNTVIEEVAV